MNLGHRLRLAREAKGLNQTEVGRMLGLTSAAISAYELEKRQPDYETLVKLAVLYGCSTDYLVGMTADPSGRESVRIRQEQIADLHNRVITLQAERDVLLQIRGGLDDSDQKRLEVTQQIERVTNDLDNARGELDGAKYELQRAVEEARRIDDEHSNASKAESEPVQDLIYFLRGSKLTPEDVEAVRDLLEARRLRREREEREKSQP